LSDRQVRTERQRYIDNVRRSVSCITPVVVLAAPLDTPNTWRMWLAADPPPLPTAPQLAIRLAQEFQHRRKIGNGSVRPYLVSYRYELSELSEREIFAYHCQPKGDSPITHPHIQVGTNDPRLSHENKHLPTGLVTLHQVIHCLITEFEVPPLRKDWADILAAGHSTIDAEGSI
jgi:hypothetical protein